ncbi:DUF551 domain-containing protein [Escherichia coli]|nr:DUF551 domain-containing protein [Escherichia coli]EJZ0183407.1 DUF551 domain-containing protein [Escherichia coli]EKD1111927.1 DUF551 domain-containing protein [Escherichia coli]HBA3032123.1 DUF551 domain-containing protein [Escherichia coli]HCT9553237.1 DUF551 domain-containing protein [Escherichia coli]
MSAITKERVELFIKNPLDNGLTRGEQMELARIALASLEAEPLCYLTWHQGFRAPDDCEEYVVEAKPGDKSCDGTPAFPVYTAPPAPVSVPAAMEMDDDFDSAFEHGKAVGWNAYRAAMLQSFGNSEQLNSPVIQDGWVACVERMPSAGEQVLAYRPDAPESNDPLIKMATYVGGSAHGHGFDCYCKPTHWMPLPAAPQEVNRG